MTLLGSTFFSFVRLFVCSEQRVDAGLVTAPLGFEPIEHIAVKAERDLRFLSNRLETTPEDRFREHLRRNLRSVGKVNVLVS